MKTAIDAFRQGISSASNAKRFIFWMWLASFILALAPALVLSQQIEDSLGSSTRAETLAEGYDDRWYQEFQADATALASSFDPSVAGAGAVFNALDGFLTGEHFGYFPGVVLIGLAYLLLWIWAGGAILQAFKTGQMPSMEDCAADGTRYFFRFLRLFLLSFLAYAFIFGWLAPFLEDHIESISIDMIDERTVFFWTLLAYILLWLLLAAVNMIFDYAKIVTVLEERRSMLGSTLRSLKLVSANPLQAFLLYSFNLLLALLFMLLYTSLAPGTAQSSWLWVILALIFGQLYIASRIFTRLCFLGSQLNLCQSWTAPSPTPSADPDMSAQRSGWSADPAGKGHHGEEPSA